MCACLPQHPRLTISCLNLTLSRGTSQGTELVSILSIHDCLSFLHEVMMGNHRTKTLLYEVMIGNHWTNTFLHEVMIGNHRNKTTES